MVDEVAPLLPLDDSNVADALMEDLTGDSESGASGASWCILLIVVDDLELTLDVADPSPGKRWAMPVERFDCPRGDV